MITISIWVPGVLEAKGWGKRIRVGTTVGDAACHSMLNLVVLLMWFSCYIAPTTTYRSSANNNKQQCCWLSMSIGGSGGTAAKSDTLVAVPFGLAVVACCASRLLPRRLLRCIA